ncbi:MAG: DnaJ domain-containing protein [Desulfarculaceae bacterium]|nr:DnaJ domain-containing protein [Desulfarculaceae bacterium]
MDIQTALRIMELTPSADLDDAKEAFRRLAKRYHPDRVKYSPESGAGDARMKEINLAFKLLKQELKSSRPREAVDKEKTAPAAEPGQPFFSFVRDWKKSFSQKRKTSHPGSEKKNRGGSEGTCASRPGRRRTGRRKRSFRQEFCKSFQASAGNGTGTPGRGRGGRFRDRSVYNYSTYMKLKKKMMSSQRRRETNPGPVGPVTRISRIKRVEK